MSFCEFDLAGLSTRCELTFDRSPPPAYIRQYRLGVRAPGAPRYVEASSVRSHSPRMEMSRQSAFRYQQYWQTEEFSSQELYLLVTAT